MEKQNFEKITMPYKLVCGLEVHAELKTTSKMFCACKNDPFGASEPNIHTCPVCLGMPGGLPVANAKAIELTIKLGLALHCKINLFSKFDRKNYFYPDLPKGYQISQYDIPFCYDGYLETSEGRVGITRIHLEEDTAKLSHQEVDLSGKGELVKVSLIDFNRSSVPLAEIVTEPDIKSATQAKEYGQKLRQIMRYLDIADCDMEKGGMRLEANISLSKASHNELPDYKVECKNINSFKFLEAAINFEVARQTEILQNGGRPIQETRGYNSATGKTFSQRTKEDAADYRYFPDPDLPPVEFTNEQIEAIRATLPELPDEKALRLITEYKLSDKSARELVITRQKAEFFESILILSKKKQIDAQKLVNALLNKKLDFTLTDTPASVLEKFEATNKSEVVDDQELEQVITQVLQANQDAVEKYKSGKTQVLGFLLGQVMKGLGKKVDMGVVKEEVVKLLA